MQVLTQTDPGISQRLEVELEAVECRFAAELMSDLPCVNTLVDHIEQYRGKMLRPRLLLTAALACSDGGDKLTESHRIAATVVEMVHMATLVHDDVLDDAHTRRGGRTINVLEGNESAVMLGDYLISHAYHLCSSLGNETVSRMIANTTNTICEGELLQLANRNNWDLDEQTYLEIVRRKTASLCGTCCRLAVILSDSGGELANRLYDYGENVGIAFQVVDDLLDLVGAEDTVGKTLGRDLEKGKLTLPLIHQLAKADRGAKRQLLELLASDPSTQNSQMIRRELTENGAVQYANDWAARLIDRAKTRLEALPDSAAKALLLESADAILTRRF